MFRIIRTIVNIIIGIIELLLALRLVFKFFLANPTAPFVSWLYGATAQLIAPFSRIFPDFKIGNFFVETTTLVALIVYVLIGYLILELFSFIGRPYMDKEV